MRIFSPKTSRQTFPLLLFVVCSCCFSQTLGLGGSFMTKILMFQNEKGLTYSGNKCSQPSSGSRSGDLNCRTYFRVCLSHYQAKINFSNCTFGSSLTPVYRINSILNSTSTSASSLNETRIAFNFAWPGDFSLTIEAWNDMSTHQGEHPKPNSGDELIFRLSQSYLNLMPSQRLINGSSEKGMNLIFEVKVTCEEKYYGSNCTTFCNARDDIYGHYRCNLTDGAKICLNGWKNPETYCMEAICKQCVNGDCRSPGNCSCHDGWSGASCDICLPSETCDRDHGYCTKPGTCICREGWGGTDCKGDLQYCSRRANICQNGGTCLNSSPGNFSCACAKGFTGRTCGDRVVSSPCAPIDNCPCTLDGDCKCPFHCSTSKLDSVTTSSIRTYEKEQTTTLVAYQSTSGRNGFPLSEGQRLTLIIIMGVLLPVTILIIVMVVYVLCRKRRRDGPPPSDNNNQQNNIYNSRIYNKTKNCEVVIRNDCSKHNKNLNLLTNSMAREKTVCKSAPPLSKPLPPSMAVQQGFDKFNKNLNRQNRTFSFENSYPCAPTYSHPCGPTNSYPYNPANCLPLRPVPRIGEGGTYEHRPAYKSVVVSLEPGSPTKSPKKHDAAIPRQDCFSPGSTDFCYVSSLSSDDSSVFSAHSNEEKIEATVV